jgi:hypothetical protein
VAAWQESEVRVNNARLMRDHEKVDLTEMPA